MNVQKTLRGIRLPELVRGAFGLTYVGGAVVHLVNWLTNPGVYGEITAFVLLDVYRDLWTSVVLPNLAVLLPVLAAFEVLVGIAILLDGRYAKAGLAAGAAFNLALAPLGFWWPSNVALAAAHLWLLRYDYPRRSFDLVRARVGRRRGTY